jgi:hypothetical protein
MSSVITCEKLENINNLFKKNHIILKKIFIRASFAQFGMENKMSTQSGNIRCIAHRITGVLDVLHRAVSWEVGTRRFGNCVCFRPQVK